MGMRRWIRATFGGLGVLAAFLGIVLVGGPKPGVAELTVNEPPPDFTLPAADGTEYTLSELKGKYVVLEWLNHGCPFVGKHYGAGNMQKLQQEYAEQGVVWLSIISSAPGKQGYCTPEQARQITSEKEAHPTAVLLDPDGTVGKAYGAKTTPHMFVINPEGMLIYQGAIDDKPSVWRRSLDGAHNYVVAALTEAMAGKAVTVQRTTPYGCSVKY